MPERVRLHPRASVALTTSVDPPPVHGGVTRTACSEATHASMVIGPLARSVQIVNPARGDLRWRQGQQSTANSVTCVSGAENLHPSPLLYGGCNNFGWTHWLASVRRFRCFPSAAGGWFRVPKTLCSQEVRARASVFRGVPVLLAVFVGLLGVPSECGLGVL